MTNTKPIIKINIPTDGSAYKYVTGIDNDGRRVVVTNTNCSMHKYIVQSYGELTDIRGGWVKFSRGRYRFSGSSGSYGMADHKMVDILVNPKMSTLESVIDKCADIREKVDYRIKYEPAEVLHACGGAVTYTSLAALVGVYAYNGFIGNTFLETTTQWKTAAIGSTILAAIVAGHFTSRKLHYRPRDNIVEETMLATPILAVYAGIAYGVGMFVKALIQSK